MILTLGKWPKYFENGLEACDTELVFENRIYYAGNGLRI